jgi:hypothetical protein
MELMTELMAGTSARMQRLLRTTLILTGLGATLGSLLDGIHSHFGALSYTTPFLAQTAWWVPLLFAGAYATGAMRPLLGSREPALPGWKAALGMGLFILSYWLTVAPWPWLVRTAIISVLFVAGWAICDGTLLGVGIALLTAIIGPTVEITLVHAGTFVHHEVFALGIPGWLPFLYLTAALGLGGLARWLTLPPELIGPEGERRSPGQ